MGHNADFTFTTHIENGELALVVLLQVFTLVGAIVDLDVPIHRLALVNVLGPDIRSLHHSDPKKKFVQLFRQECCQKELVMLMLHINALRLMPP